MEEGRTRRDRLESKLDRAIRKDRSDIVSQIEADLVTPPFPLSLNYVWQAWTRLRRRKPAGESGPEPIGWPDIDAFVRRTGTRLDPYDVDLIEELDDLYLAAMADQASLADKQQALKDGLRSIERSKR